MPESRKPSEEQRTRRYRAASLVIFALGVVFSMTIAQLTLRVTHEKERARFEHSAEMVRTLLEERLNDQLAALRGLRAFIDSSEEVTRKEWGTFVDDLEIARHFKGCAGFSFIRHLHRRDLPAFLEQARGADPDFAVDSPGDGPDLYLAELIHPLQRNLPLVGYNLAGEPGLAALLAGSRRVDAPVLTRGLVRFQETDGAAVALLLLPVYHKNVQGRPLPDVSARLRGWVAATIMVGETLAGIDDYFDASLDIELLDVSPDGGSSLLYDSGGKVHSKASRQRGGSGNYEMASRTTLSFAGRSWALNIFALPGFTSMIADTLPGAVFLAGFLLSLLSAQQLSSYGRTLRRAQHLAGQMTRELRLSEQRFHRMFSEHNAVMLLINPESGEIVDANEAAVRFYGYAREEFVALPIGRINTLPEDETRRLMQQVKRGQGRRFEFRHTLRGGEVRDVEVYSSPIEVEGQPLLFSIIHDITERKRAEGELSRYREGLEEMVEKKTRQLTKAHAELLQRERLVTLGRLTATVSHELRNPLGTIKSALFSIAAGLERKDPAQAQRPLELAERSIDRCVRIIEELNSYARVRPLKLAATALDDWLRELVDEQELPEGVALELEIDCGGVLTVDRDKLRQILVNLLSNALHALQEKAGEDPRIVITTQRYVGGCEIRVRDNGVGMSAETQEKVFEALYSTKGFGVGLGMGIVKNLVEQHGGEVKIESELGVGTTVSVRLPLETPAG